MNHFNYLLVLILHAFFYESLRVTIVNCDEKVAFNYAILSHYC